MVSHKGILFLDIEKSIYYNEKAKEIKPNNEMVLTNSDILLKIKREA